MAAWPPHSLDHSDRQRIFVAAGTALYSPKCSRLYNLQGLWSVPATWCSHPLHLKDRQNVQNSAQHTAHPQERGSCQAKGRRRDRWGYLIQSHFSIEPTAGSSWQGKTRRRRAILPSERGLGEILVLKCGCLGSSGVSPNQEAAVCLDGQGTPALELSETNSHVSHPGALCLL